MTKSRQLERTPVTLADVGSERVEDVARPRVLLIDDDASHRDLLNLSLAESGYDVVEVGDGGQAIDYLLHNPAPSMILLDLIMPGL